MDVKRRGSQTPTKSRYLPYAVTLGPKAVELYNKTGRNAQEWQEVILSEIMGQDAAGLWVHSRFGYQVSRRNGKSEVVIMREMWALSTGEKVLHTAHRTSTSHASWDLLVSLLSKAGFVEGEDYKTYKQLGFEQIRFLKTEGLINYRTRSSKAGLGEGYDLLIVDEAQEYTTDQASALKYVISASPNPQTIFCGTPPTVVSAGTVFKDYRERCLKGEAKNAGWAEWSVDELTDPHDVDAWYMTNPSLGVLLTERAIDDEIDDDKVDFNIQRLGLWLEYNQKSAISKNAWEACRVDVLPELSGKLFAGIKYGKDAANVALSIAVRTWDGQIFVEAIDCRPIREGNAWLLAFLQAADVEKVVIDGYGQAGRLADDLADVGLKRLVHLPTTSEFINANSSFAQAVEDKAIEHRGQPSLAAVVTNCDRRAIGSSGGFGFKSLSLDNDIVLLDSVILAFWACSVHVEKRRQSAAY